MAYCVRLCAMAGKLGGSQPSFDLDELPNANASLKCQVEFCVFSRENGFSLLGLSRQLQGSVLRKCPDCFDLSGIAAAAEQRNHKFPILIHAPWESPIFPSSLDQFPCNSRRRI